MDMGWNGGHGGLGPMPGEPGFSFHYLKSRQFRVIHVDGAHGGPMPNGRGLNVALFSERGPLPQSTHHPVGPHGELLPEDLAARVTKQGAVREVEVMLAMDLSTAEAVHQWLGQQIEQLRDVQRRPPGRG
jgi:hypothetical protein